MEKGKKLTLEALLAKKEQREAAKYEISQVNIPSLGGYLQLEKIPLTRVAAMMDQIDGESMTENLDFNVRLIYACCPMMKNKELQAAYQVSEPKDIVCAVLDDNMGDINLIVSAILSMYGLSDSDNLKTSIKN